MLAAALRIADAEGVEALSVRRVARDLGVMPNALYSHVADKDALLDAVLDALLGELAVPPAASGWREGLAALLDDSRRLLARHPKLIELFFTRPTLGPNAARLGEETFRLLRDAGLDGEAAVGAFRVLMSYALGYAALQGPRAGDRGRARRAAAAWGGRSGEGHPEMRAVARPLSQPPGDAEFRRGLQWLLDGLAAARGQRAGARAGSAGGGRRPATRSTRPARRGGRGRDRAR